MPTLPAFLPRETRWLRATAFAALLWAAVRAFFAVPWFDAAEPVAAWASTLFWAVAPFVLLATALLRGTITVGALLGGYGVYCLVVAAAAWGRVLTGAAAADPRGPGVVWAATLVVPFALVWARGGLAAWRVLSTPTSGAHDQA